MRLSSHSDLFTAILPSLQVIHCGKNTVQENEIYSDSNKCYWNTIESHCEPVACVQTSPISFVALGKVVSLAAVFSTVTQRSSPQTAAHIRTTFLSHCFCGLMKGPIMYQQIENDVSVRAKKDNGTSGRSFSYYGGQNRNTEKSSGRKLKVFRGFFALRY